MLTSKSYTVAWDERLYVTEEFDKQMQGFDYLVWDRCSKPVKHANWIEAEDVRYFGHLYNSLVDFSKTEHGVFIFSAGDILCDDFASFVSKVERMMSDDADIWMMTPHLPTDQGSGMPTAIVKSTLYPDMYLTTHINGLYMVMRRELAEMLLDYYEWMLEKGYMDFSTMISGHCIDWVYSAMVLLHNKKTYRDMSTEMYEVDGTSYNTVTALRECNMVRDRYIDWAGTFGISEQSVRSTYEVMSVKVKRLYREFIDLKMAYPLIELSEDFRA